MNAWGNSRHTPYDFLEQAIAPEFIRSEMIRLELSYKQRAEATLAIASEFPVFGMDNFHVKLPSDLSREVQYLIFAVQNEVRLYDKGKNFEANQLVFENAFKNRLLKKVEKSASTSNIIAITMLVFITLLLLAILSESEASEETSAIQLDTSTKIGEIMSQLSK